MTAPPPTMPEPTRQEAILAAAFQTFCQYGFRRTTMEDIARAAAMSRAALYLHFRNKQDIHRAMVQRYFDATLERMQTALRPHTPPAEALKAALLAKVGPEMDAVFASPHGAELMDANASTSADIIRAGEDRLLACLAAWLDARAGDGSLSLTPGMTAAQTARLLFHALPGIKDPAAGPEGWRDDAARLAVLFARALGATEPPPARPAPPGRTDRPHHG